MHDYDACSATSLSVAKINNLFSFADFLQHIHN